MHLDAYVAAKAGHRSTLHSCVPAFTCVLSAHLRVDVDSIWVCQHLQEQCLHSKITSVARVEYVLLLRFVAGNLEVNTLASKRSELIGNAAIVRKRSVIHNKSTCVCLRLPVAAITQKRRGASFDLWPALHSIGSTAMYSIVSYLICKNMFVTFRAWTSLHL